MTFSMVDRSLPAGLRGYLPSYRWYYRREGWEEIPADVRTEGTKIVLTGPMTDMATDGFNLRAERLGAAFIRGLAPDLELDLNWQRPVRLSMMCGEDVRRLETLPATEGPWSPFRSLRFSHPRLDGSSSSARTCLRTGRGRLLSSSLRSVLR